MAQKPAFDISKLSTASKILLGAGLLLFIDMLLQWNQACALGFCAGVSGWHGGLGVILGLLVLVLLIWEGLRVLNVKVAMGTMSPAMLSAIIAGAVTLFAILRFLVKPSAGPVGVSRSFFAWIGLILGLVIGYGAYLAMQEAGTSPAAPPPADTPGFTA